ncbi:oxidative DNA demethylase [Martiniozyma asiatica (nom. inval.)]|nr:oxidative DNA demethylase [Martiniozyma asiatica]
MTSKRSLEGSMQPKKKISIKQTPQEEAAAKDYFQSHVFEPNFKNALTDSVKDSEPYRWGTIKNLINEELLRNVRKEIMKEIEFTKKETDIYKVFQSGDLANLSAMPAELLERLPSLYKLRSAIYSQTFRDFISDVTGAGKLSGIKTDLSLQMYTKTCHLLTHDDVIGSRRVSFILYMPDPDTPWKPHYGGGLQLLDSIVPNVPQSDIHSTLVPNFNQIAFFTVQPGKSFHAVEEVRVDKQRLSLQGWFHIPQPGEPHYIPGEQEATEAKSTLHQLESKELLEYDFPKPTLTTLSSIEQAESILPFNEFDRNYLAQYVNEQLLTDDSILKLASIFEDKSVVDIMSFLSPQCESKLKKMIKNFELNQYPPMPQCQSEVEYPWKLAIPSHKQRYLYMDGLAFQDISNAESIKLINQSKGEENPNFSMMSQFTKADMNTMIIPDDAKEINPLAITHHNLSIELSNIAAIFRSISFKKWLYAITKLPAIRDQILVRRFRPGMDFILATRNKESEEDAQSESVLEGFLEATLNLTPTRGWDSGDFGGYELCLVDDDPDIVKNAYGDKTGQLNEDEAAIYRKADDDSVVYEAQTGWNKFSLMFRDESVLKFVKYISYDAPGSRWDIVGNWKCVDESDE